MNSINRVVAMLSLTVIPLGFASSCNGDGPEEPLDTGDAAGDAAIVDGEDDTESFDAADTVALDAADTTDDDVTDTSGADIADTREADLEDTREPSAEPRTLRWDFDDGVQRWQPSFTDYSESMADSVEFEFGLRPLPEELEEDGEGYLLAGTNVSDDLFMFLRRPVGLEVDLAAETPYQLEWTITFASNAPSNCFGIGGPPGESVYMKAGGSMIEPRRVRNGDATADFILNVDKGNQSTGGEAASVVGHIANGIPCDDAQGEYVELVREHTHPVPVETNEEGRLWLMVGTDSGFEGRTALYYMSLEVTLRPVE